MSLSTSRRPIKYDFVDFIFVSSLIVIVLLVLAPLNNIYNTHTSVEKGSTHAMLSGDPSFASDRQYWDANCRHDLTFADSTCQAIAARAQSCSISVDSVYCSQYANYMQQFHRSQK
jgi:hypothetical protein